jgi:hypothetical protein
MFVPVAAKAARRLADPSPAVLSMRQSVGEADELILEAAELPVMAFICWPECTAGCPDKGNDDW